MCREEKIISTSQQGCEIEATTAGAEAVTGGVL